MSEEASLAEKLPLIVVGGGFAGIAAAWTAARAGSRVTLIHAGAGASELYSGIVDGTPKSPEIVELSMLLGLSVTAVPRAVATRQGMVRAAAGRDRSLLDLEALAGRRVALLDLGRDEWDAPLLAKSYNESAWSKRTRTEFEAVRVDALVEGAERRIAAYDLAARFDETARLASLAEAMRKASPDAAGWLTEPVLGLRSETAAQLAALLSRPVGETSSLPGGVAGARFELRRDEVLGRAEVQSERARVTRVRALDGALSVQLARGDALRARAAVLALGGVAAGGLVLAAHPGQPLAFELSVSADVALRLDGEVLDAGSSVWGPSFSRKGMALLDRVGIHDDGNGRVHRESALFAAGDVLADRPRSVLEALSAGARAGLAASQVEP